MMSVGIAIVMMVVATVAVHLGLPQAIAKVMVKVFGCHKCLTFWSTLVVVQLFGYSIDIALSLSILAAYLSNWFALLLVWYNKLYEYLWKEVNE